MAAYTEVTVRPSPPLVQPSCLQREASGKLVSAAEGGDLQQVLIILALGADINTPDRVGAAAGVCKPPTPPASHMCVEGDNAQLCHLSCGREGIKIDPPLIIIIIFHSGLSLSLHP